jgi:hypothetical protein
VSDFSSSVQVKWEDPRNFFCYNLHTRTPNMANLQQDLERMMGSTPMGGFRGDAGNYTRAPNPVATQMKSYSYYLWLPMPFPSEEDRATQQARQMTVEQKLQYLRDTFPSMEDMSTSNGVVLAKTAKRLDDGTVIQNLDWFMQRPLLESDKVNMTAEQMRVTLLSAMIPALDVKKWTLKSQMWPIIVKLAQGVLIEPRPEVLAAPCKWYSKMQLTKYVQSLGIDSKEELAWREAFSTPDIMCQTYADMFASKLTDAAFSDAVAKGAMRNGTKAMENARRRGYAEAGYQGGNSVNSSSSGPIGNNYNTYANNNNNTKPAPRKRKASKSPKKRRRSKSPSSNKNYQNEE